MAFEEGTTTVMPVAPTGYGFGGGMGVGNDWLVILFLFAMMGGGFGGFGGGAGYFPWLFGGQAGINANTNAGFADAALGSQISAIQASLNASEIAACNRAMDSMQTAYNNQIAGMNQSFANAQALDARLNDLAMGLQNCCCENRSSIADLKYTIATEACADRAAVNDALRDVLTANTANTQRILDVLCQQDISAKQDRINDLERQLNLASLSASQTAQTASIIAALKPATTTA